MPPLNPYKGHKRRLILSFDVGTTYSGVSYCVLEPGQVPRVDAVMKFPCQEFVNISSKIPSVVYYDKKGVPRAIGAETLVGDIYETALTEDWTKVEWFKLQLRSSDITSSGDKVHAYMSPLPPEKSAVEVLADYMKYLFRCSQEYIEECLPNGKDLWMYFEEHHLIHFVLPHPNGWDEVQQSQMRKAVYKAGLVEDTPCGNARIFFVTEGEACLHFAINHGFPAGSISEESGLIVVDAGGGTIDVSAYTKKNTDMTDSSYEDITRRRCHLEGSIFVSHRFEACLTDHLRGSKYEEDVSHIVACFDEGAKLRFRRSDNPQYIKFGTINDNDKKKGIRFGQLMLSGEVVASCFEPAINRIVNDVEEIIKDTPGVEFKRVVLVGGLAANDWVYHCVNKALLLLGVFAARPKHNVTRAVADGALSSYLSQLAQQRVIPATYGAFILKPFKSLCLLHWPPLPLSLYPRHKLDNGELCVQLFQPLLIEGTILDANDEFRCNDTVVVSDRKSLAECTITLFRHDGDLKPISMCRGTVFYGGIALNKDILPKVCTIKADIQHLRNTTAVKKGHGKLGKYYQLDYTFILKIRATRMKAEFAWKENNIENRMNAEIVYEEAETPIHWSNLA